MPRAVADRPMRFDRPRITLDALAEEAAAAYAGHHDRQVNFAGRACRCKFSGAETLSYVKANLNSETMRTLKIQSCPCSGITGATYDPY